MKLKLALSTFILIVFGLILAAEFNLVNAQNSFFPSTGPITRPITYFTYKISGKVTYRFFYRIKPAQDVLVEANKIYTNEVYITKTDANGNYAFSVKKGEYIIKASDQKRTVFYPRAQYVNSIKDIFNVNFVGILINR